MKLFLAKITQYDPSSFLRMFSLLFKELIFFHFSHGVIHMLSYDSVHLDTSIKLHSCLFDYAKLKQYHDLPKRTFRILF